MLRAKPRLYRDPVHDTITLAPGTEEGRLLMKLVDAREVQRLRRIRQLGFSSLVYHGAEHSRFAHSLGTMWVARRMLDQLSAAVAIDPIERLATVAAALLHDVGHGPLSHALERLGGPRHEARSTALILHPKSEIHRALAEIDPRFPARVAARINAAPDAADEHLSFLGEIVSSQLDADRFDYIRRDALMTGVHIGHFDLERILAMLEVVDGAHIAVHEGGQAAVEGYLLARFHMFQQVYLHKTSRTAERMLIAALTRAAALRRQARGPSWWPGGALGDLVLGERAGEDAILAFADLDDLDVWHALKRWSEDDDPALSELAGGLVRRRLWKSFTLPMGDAKRSEELIAAARSVARRNGFNPDHHVLIDASEGSPYRPYSASQHAPSATHPIRLIDRGGRVAFIEDRSEIVEMLGRLRHARRLLCVHPDLRASLAALFEPPSGATPRGIAQE